MLGNIYKTPWWMDPVGDYTVDEQGQDQLLLELEGRKRNVSQQYL